MKAGVLVLGLLALIAAAGTADAARIAGISGACTLTTGGKPQPCTGVVYMEFPETGRANFTVPFGDGALAFSGSELTGTAESTTLTLDAVVEVRADATTIDHPASGTCTLSHDAAVTVIRSLRCTAVSDLGALTLMLAGDGSPLDLRELG